MTLECDAKFEEKLSCGLENNIRNLASFHQSTFESLKIGTLMWSFYPKLCVIARNNDAKFEEELTCQFKIAMTILTNFDMSTRKSRKFTH